jgi:hypothetical protein
MLIIYIKFLMMELVRWSEKDYRTSFIALAPLQGEVGLYIPFDKFWLIGTIKR